MKAIAAGILALSWMPAAGSPSQDTVPLPAPDRERAELPKPGPDGWIPLFNGKDLKGWYGDPKVWRVKDGYISGMTEKQGYNTFLIFNHPFSDFILEAKFLLVGKKGNSGIQIRSKVHDPAKWIVGGYQPDIGEGWFGSLYEERGRGVLVKAPKEVGQTVKGDDWNQIVITARGPQIKMELNGAVTFDYEEKDEKKGAREGIIALQYHVPGGFEIRFKDLRIKILTGR